MNFIPWLLLRAVDKKFMLYRKDTDILIRLHPFHFEWDMRMSDKSAQSNQPPERRHRYRSKDLSNPMIVISLSGGPLYQLKLRDLSYEGAGIVVRADSQFLQKVEIGRELKVRVVLPRGYQGPSGYYQSRVEHITELQEGPYKGHLIVGLSFLTGVKST